MQTTQNHKEFSYICKVYKTTIMKVSELLQQHKDRTAFSFEILPPLKGNRIQTVFNTIDKLKEFDPQYINITTHHTEYVYKELENGMFQRVSMRRRPGTVAVAAAITYKYGIPTIPHILCSGFSKEATEYLLLDLQFLGITNLLLLRGDKAKDERRFTPTSGGHAHTTDLICQVNRFNEGFFLDGTPVKNNAQPFTFGVACYPEKHIEALNEETDLAYLKIKQDMGAEYAVTQLFYDNQKYYRFVEKARQAGITIPIIPGIKPFSKLRQLNIIPETFNVDFPEEFVKEALKCKSDEDTRQFGIEWCVAQCKDLMAHGVPDLHFYTVGAVDNVREIAAQIY